MAKASDNQFPKVILEEVATDGSATSSPAADHRALFLGEDGALHLKDSGGSVTDIGGGGGGGVSGSYLGTNSLGASNATMTGSMVYMKKITLSAGQIILSVGFGLHGGTGQVVSFAAGVWADSAGSPTNLISASNMAGDNGTLNNSTSRFLDLPVGACMPGAVDVWIGVMARENSEQAIRYASGTGSDKTLAGAFGGLYDVSVGTLSATTNDYSIRALVI